MNDISRFCTRMLLAVFMFLSAFPVKSEESNMYIPLARYDYIAFDSQAIRTAGLGSVLIGETFTIFGTYKYSSFSEPAPPGYPETFHSINIMVETHKDKHQVVTNFISESDQPVSGGWVTFQGSAIYIYQLVKNEKWSIGLGLGMALGDFGIDLEGGGNWPLLPIPYLGIGYTTSLIKGEFSFVSGPSLSFTFFPEKRFSISGEFQMEKFRDLRDLIFTAGLHFRFFTEDDPSGDIAGIAIGVRNNNSGFTPRGSDDSYEMQYYSLFTELDLAILKITGAYAFKGRERLGDNLILERGDGFFLNLQALYQF